MKNEQIGRMLRYYRTLRKLSVQTVSDKLKDANLPSATKTIYAWESGRTQPDADRLLYLCKLYEIDDILTESGYLPKDARPFRATAFEKRLILAYRDHPEIQSAVNKLLELD